MMSRTRKAVGLPELALQFQLTVKKVQNISVDKVNNFTTIELNSKLLYLHISGAASFKR